MLLVYLDLHITEGQKIQSACSRGYARASGLRDLGNNRRKLLDTMIMLRNPAE